MWQWKLQVSLREIPHVGAFSTLSEKVLLLDELDEMQRRLDTLAESWKIIVVPFLIEGGYDYDNKTKVFNLDEAGVVYLRLKLDSSLVLERLGHEEVQVRSG